MPDGVKENKWYKFFAYNYFICTGAISIIRGLNIFLYSISMQKALLEVCVVRHKLNIYRIFISFGNNLFSIIEMHIWITTNAKNFCYLFKSFSNNLMNFKFVRHRHVVLKKTENVDIIYLLHSLLLFNWRRE